MEKIEELFDKWYEENEIRFHHAQMSEKEIAFSAYVKGYQKAKEDDNNVEIIKGLLKYIKNQEVLWTDDLDIIFSPDFKADGYNPPSTVTQPL